ncbi:hypothetical protein PPYR_02455 [Photinus pyralis]|uniref:Oxysterol-binding protein n=1 Tax=Photinus pyralis TaxID=7054 RepID=A0A1Y1K4Z6_PHOPY|nr:oxysterol-binding protein-related protein 9 isoform X1 [Photinus pyralis]XP_031353714.1 oxysterol-binding protein-related protein 9 isoform X1 [Photinus pyralis]KAB0805485.1 hypothetical protein PPYR_02455 [Photinus pyralis]
MAVMEGSLSKWTNVMKGWQYRWFVLDENSGLLSYYTSKEKMMRGVRRGCVRLKGAVIGIDDEDESTFTVTVDHKTFHFQARDAEEREKWVRALEDTILRHANRLRWDSSAPVPSVKDFDNKVSEADAYLQLMIEQTRLLEDKIDTLADLEEKTKCQLILEHANTMLHNIKHSIVLLQIAKNTAHPVNGVYQARSESSGLNSALSNNGSETCAIPGEANVQQGIELGSECLEARRHNSLVGSVTSTTLAVPEMSYSSSEGEDDFYDANDSPFTPGSQVPTPTGTRPFNSEDLLSRPVAAPVPNAIQGNQIRRGTLRKTGSLEHIDYDSLYDDEEELDVEMDSQGSVIRHLLSQVKIGMDLTKVVLPTFILERRSLLEMYADYFAHPDIFISIADFNTPRDRMIQVVRWYLSSYHAGRKSSVAKKPYNPVLGETFSCHWELPPTSPRSQHNEQLVSDGPVPWASRDQLTFIAEQVSHHPPISAFYAEHYNKRISFNAHIYTKSKFLGLSVCVYNIGQGVVSVLDYDEEYFVTFPSGYGRSILTIPWIELGGSVSITCPKTGYYSNVEFLTKPFYGNKKHKITAEVFGPDERRPFVSISGEWNGVMEAKWSDKEKPEEFVNVNNLSIIKKQIRPINEQTDNESRKLWKEVTRALKFNDIDKATTAKFQVEQRQRDEARERKMNNTEWETKLFQKHQEDRWLYMRPLRSRIL